MKRSRRDFLAGAAAMAALAGLRGGNLLALLRRLVADGNTAVIVEHKLSLIAQADWVIDIGPGGGADGGEILYSGIPAGLLSCARSKTAAYLAAATS